MNLNDAAPANTDCWSSHAGEKVQTLTLKRPPHKVKVKKWLARWLVTTIKSKTSIPQLIIMYLHKQYPPDKKSKNNKGILSYMHNTHNK